MTIPAGNYRQQSVNFAGEAERVRKQMETEPDAYSSASEDESLIMIKDANDHQYYEARRI